jgi:hypothetical protein
MRIRGIDDDRKDCTEREEETQQKKSTTRAIKAYKQ